MFLCLEIANFPCNFEDNICQWTQDDSDDFDWTRNRALTPHEGSGPLADHTKGLDKGYIILLIEIPSLSSPSYSPSLSLPSALALSPVYQHYHHP